MLNDNIINPIEKTLLGFNLYFIILFQDNVMHHYHQEST